MFRAKITIFLVAFLVAAASFALTIRDVIPLTSSPVFVIGNGADVTSTNWTIPAGAMLKGYAVVELAKGGLTAYDSCDVNIDIVARIQKMSDPSGFSTRTVSGGDNFFNAVGPGAHILLIPDSVLSASPYLQLRIDPNASSADSIKVWLKYMNIE